MIRPFVVFQGAIYQRVNPSREIDARARDNFWAKEEEEEKKRQAEEQRRKEMERKKREEELKQREVRVVESICYTIEASYRSLFYRFPSDCH